MTLFDTIVVPVTDLYKYFPDAVPPNHAVSYHVATDKPPIQDGAKFWSIFSDNLQPIATRRKKHVARYWSINTAATAVLLSAHPSPLAITTKLAILGGRLFGGGVLPSQYCPCGPCSDVYHLGHSKITELNTTRTRRRSMANHQSSMPEKCIYYHMWDSRVQPTHVTHFNCRN